LSVSKEWSVSLESGLGIGLDFKSSGSGGVELYKSFSGGCNDSAVGLESLLLGSVLTLVVSESGLPSLHVTWERSGIGSSRGRDLISELGDKADNLLNGSTIAGLGEHGEGVDERKIGGVLSKSLEFLSNFF